MYCQTCLSAPLPCALHADAELQLMGNELLAEVRVECVEPLRRPQNGHKSTLNDYNSALKELQVCSSVQLTRGCR